MDPLTAGLTALATFNQFLLTPPGQKLATDFENVIAGLFNVLHVHLLSTLPASTPPQGATK